MTIDAIIGNPYQVVDGGGNGAAAMPIYNKFVCCKRYAPTLYLYDYASKWYGGGRGLDDFRKMMPMRHILTTLKISLIRVSFLQQISVAEYVFRWSKTHNSNIALL